MPNKLTDKEIVKALEDLKKCNNNEIDCSSCALSDFYPQCPEKIGEISLDLINRLQGENEKKDKRLKEVLKGIETIKEQAYKEVIEKVKERKYQSSEWSHGGHPFVVEEDDIDDVLEELVGEDK